MHTLIRSIQVAILRAFAHVCVFALGVQLVIGSAVQVAMIGLCFAILALASALGVFKQRNSAQPTRQLTR